MITETRCSASFRVLAKVVTGTCSRSGIRTGARARAQSKRPREPDALETKYRVYIYPSVYSPPSTISWCRNTWSSARRRYLARPKRTVCIQLARNCCPPRVPTYNPIRSRPRNFTVFWNHPAWTWLPSTTPPCQFRLPPPTRRPEIPPPSCTHPSFHSRRPGRRNRNRTACSRICSSCSCSCTTHSCST